MTLADLRQLCQEMPGTGIHAECVRYHADGPILHVHAPDLRAVAIALVRLGVVPNDVIRTVGSRAELGTVDGWRVVVYGDSPPPVVGTLDLSA